MMTPAVNKRFPDISPTATVASLLGMAMIGLFIRSLLTINTERPAALHPVALVATPPLAQPPRPEVKKPDEPQTHRLEQLDLKSWTPTTAQDSQPGAAGGPLQASGPLGLAEAGEGGGDAFGLAGRPGGRELLLTGGGGGGGNPNGRFAEFTQRLESHVQKELNQHEDLKNVCYTIDILLRVSANGFIEEPTVKKSTGQPELDARIKRALDSLQPLDIAPPSGLPWPVGLRIVSHRADCRAVGAGPPK
jgi:protein TonB